jgi:hypothetical protein
VATTDLKTFILERLEDFDPTLTLDNNREILTKVVNPLIKRLGTDPMSTDIESFIEDRINEEFPDLDIKAPGSNLRDVLVRPLSVILDPLKREIEFLKTQQSIEDTESLTSEELDAILSNLFVERSPGSFARTEVRVFYNNPQKVAVDASIIFPSRTGIAFIPEEPRTYSPGDMIKSGSLYYITVPVRSMVPHKGANVGPDEIRSVTGLQNVVRVTNPAKATGGFSRDTDEEFIVKAERSLTERSPVTKRGIESVLFSSFDDLKSLEIVGYGDPEMQRDVLEVAVDGTPTSSFLVAGELITTLSGDLDGNQILITGDVTTTATPGRLIRIVYPTGGEFKDQIFSKLRVISSSSYSAPYTYIYTTDLTAAASGGSVSPSVWGDNRYTTTGSNKIIRVADGSPYRGAPLPFTDFIRTGINLSGYTPQPGRDFLFVNTDPSGIEFKAYPIRSVHPDGFGNYHVRVGRLDSFMMDESYIITGLSTGWEPDRNKLMADIEIEVVAMGIPDYEVASPSYDGIETVTSGFLGGAAVETVGAGVVTVKLNPANPSVPASGWTGLGARVGHYMSLACINPLATNPIWQDSGRITALPGGSPYDATVTGVDHTELEAATTLGFTGGAFPSAPGSEEYRAGWTIYVGERGVYTPDNQSAVVYEAQTWGTGIAHHSQ